MINRLRNTSSFYIPYLALLCLAIVFYFYQEHGDFVLWLNSLHNPIWDFFFKYWTYTGHGVFFTIIAIGLIFLNKRFGLVLSLIGITIGGITAFFKEVLFDEAPRPRIFFEGQKLLDFVDGVNVLSFHSFPSGHAMGVFGLATFFSLMLQNNKYSMLLLTGASFTAISRIYLAQHFLIDIMAGSLAGVIISTAFYMSFEKYLNKEDTERIKSPDEDLADIDLNNVDMN